MIQCENRLDLATKTNRPGKYYRQRIIYKSDLSIHLTVDYCVEFT